MKNKTCGECKCYDMHGGCNKLKNTLWIHSTNIACIKFEAKNPTNGDRIRQMNTSGLIDVISCPYPNKDCIHRLMNGYACKCCKRDWLNAPADDCVKQNGNHDTQTDLCKVNNTESEVEDDE